MESVKLHAIVKRHGHNKKLVGFELVEAPPHVIRFVTGLAFDEFEIIAEIIRFGYRLEIETLYEEVSILEIFSTTDCASEITHAEKD